MDTLEEILIQINRKLSEKPYDEVNKQQTWQFVFSLFPDDVIEIYKNHNDISNRNKILDELFKIIDYLTADLEDMNYLLSLQLLYKLIPLGSNSAEISKRINSKIDSIRNQDNKPLLVKYPWILGLTLFVIIILIIIIAT